MRAQRPFLAGVVLVSSVLVSTATVSAQSTGNIAGLVTDESGAVVPGVTVEASSPALIEGVRTAVSDDAGRFKVEALQPGTYKVTFKLEGFRTYVREGIVLTTDFTATVNAKMAVGALQETVTVTGGAPMVDVQNVKTQETLSREVLDTVPTGKTWSGYAALTVGLQPDIRGDVGGSKGDVYAFVSINGSRVGDGAAQMDGFSINDQTGDAGGNSKHFIVDQAAIQEVVIATSGSSAEQETGGVIVNNVVRDGGNHFSVYSNLSGTSGKLQNSNLDDALRARQVTQQGQLKKIFDLQIAGGGPIVKDKVWFYTAHRKAVSQEYSPFSFYNKFGYGFSYAPDLSRPGFTDFHFRDDSGRVTWQVSSKDKISFYTSVQNDCQCHYWVQLGGGSADAAFQYGEQPKVYQWMWSRPTTTKLLLEGGFSYHRSPEYSRAQPDMPASAIGIFEVSSGTWYNTRVTSIGGAAASDINNRDNMDGRFTVSYVTGTHAMKVGVRTYHGIDEFNNITIPHDVSYTFLNGSPISLTEWATPSTNHQAANTLALFAQDQWTIKKFTLSLGVRYDHLNAYVPDQTRPAGQFVSELHVTRIDNVPNWNDIDPRLGVAYDLHGDGRTALKAAVGRYVTAKATALARALNPANAIVQSVARTWNDGNGNFVPDCDLHNNSANGECGAVSDAGFGTVRVSQTFDPALLTGFGVREYDWQGSVGIQQELRRGWAAEVVYHRTQFGNFTVTDNLLVTPTDYSPYSITAPSNPLLPGGGGYTVTGLYDINPNKFGRFNGLIVPADRFGKQTEIYNGVAVNLTGHPGKGIQMAGGVNFGRRTTDRCFVVDSPQELYQCKVTPPWSAGTDVKFNGSYPLPFASTIAWVFQNLPGTVRTATYSASNAAIVPTLGRNLAAGANARVNVEIVQPQTEFEKRQTQVDLRFTKTFAVIKQGRIRAWIDLYNVFNANTILGVNTAYSATWPVPTVLLGGRLLKFGTQIDF